MPMCQSKLFLLYQTKLHSWFLGEFFLFAVMLPDQHIIVGQVFCQLETQYTDTPEDLLSYATDLNDPMSLQ